MVFNSCGPIHKQSQEAPEVVETVEADIELPEPVEAPIEAKVAPKKTGTRKKAKKSEDK